MPLYSFQCSACQHTNMEFQQMRNAVPVGESVVCPKCGASMYQRQADYVHTDLKEFDTPIEMHSVGCNSWEEIREIQTKCPDVEISDNPDDELFGIPIARNRKQKLSVLRTVGYVERN